MKKLLYLIPLMLILFSVNITAKSYTKVGFGFFYSNLASYGEWVEFDYGVVAFHPRVHNRSWAPYTMGRWLWTDDGWYWDSYESFGAITYHYGRWFYDDYYGWLWIPDYDWAPAWVEWRYDNDYIGWAPLSPYAEYSASFGIRYSHPYTSPYHHWHFVDNRHFCDDHIYNRFVVGETVKYRVYNNTRSRNDYDTRNGRIINRGFDVQTIRQRGVKVTERQIERVTNINELKNSGRNDTRVRSLVLDRDRIAQGDNKERTFTKATRTSMELKNVQIGRDEQRTRDNNTTRTTVTNTERKTTTVEHRDNSNTTTQTKRTDVKENERTRVLKENERVLNSNRNDVTLPQNRNERKQVQTRVENSQNNNRSSSTDKRQDVKVERKTQTRTNVNENRTNNNNVPQMKREKTVEKKREQGTTRQRTEDKKDNTKRDAQIKQNERTR